MVTNSDDKYNNISLMNRTVPVSVSLKGTHLLYIKRNKIKLSKEVRKMVEKWIKDGEPRQTTTE